MYDCARTRLLAAGLSLTLAALALTGCSEVEESGAAGYEPAHLEEVVGSEVQQVTFTQEGADRTGLKTATVRRDGERWAVPYEALIYDGAGKSWVYTVPRPLTYVRAEIDVNRVAGDRVLMTDGPAAGTEVVTVGATEVYGAELEIGGGH